MRVLRVALLFPALAFFATPTFALVDRDPSAETIVQPSPRAIAVQAALDQAGETADPIEKLVISGVRDFYTARNFEPLWLADLHPTAQMSALRQAMDDATDYGLDPGSYATPNLAPSYPDDPPRLAAADVEFTLAVARFVTHVASGRVAPSDISALITLQPERPDIGEALSRLSQSADPAANIALYEPPQEQYAALKTALAELRKTAAEEEERVVVPEGDLLKPGGADSRVPLLRARLEIPLAPEADPEIYDDSLVDAVKAFQTDSGLNADGIVGPQTLVVMNGRSREEEIASVLANLERWRWMPRELGAFHVFVNVPEFKVRVVENGAVVHETRVIVGKPKNPTPTFSHVMSHVIVNPYWNVPASIVKNELMPELRSDPWGFSAQGYEIFARVRGRTRQIDPRWVAWYGVDPRLITIRQVPGDHNALGRIKFMFPNQHDVYLHDTPSKSLFKRDFRALSHGCVRVENPFDFADAILPHAAPDWNSSRLKDLFAPQERRVDLDTPIPVHLAYFTAWVDADGTLRHFDDIYGYDGAITASLGT
jgi:murein L,D-transpeptidase YcbB/YkuD